MIVLPAMLPHPLTPTLQSAQKPSIAASKTAGLGTCTAVMPKPPGLCKCADLLQLGVGMGDPGGGLSKSTIRGGGGA